MAQTAFYVRPVPKQPTSRSNVSILGLVLDLERQPRVKLVDLRHVCGFFAKPLLPALAGIFNHLNFTPPNCDEAGLIFQIFQGLMSKNECELIG